MNKEELMLELMHLNRQHEESSLELLRIINELAEKLDRTQKERDAVISDIEELIKKNPYCDYCANRDMRWGICKEGCNKNCKPKWRGIIK